jgi:hypothetical protein
MQVRAQEHGPLLPVRLLLQAAEPPQGRTAQPGPVILGEAFQLLV